MSASDFLRSVQRYPPAEENRRRLARYDEAIRLLREADSGGWVISSSLATRLRAFLAAEPKEGR